MNTLQMLKNAERRLNGLRIHNPSSTEYIRYRDVIVPDLKTRLTEDEQAEYEIAQKGKSQQQLELESQAELAAMNENRDKPSI